MVKEYKVKNMFSYLNLKSYLTYCGEHFNNFACPGS